MVCGVISAHKLPVVRCYPIHRPALSSRHYPANFRYPVSYADFGAVKALHRTRSVDAFPAGIKIASSAAAAEHSHDMSDDALAGNSQALDCNISILRRLAASCHRCSAEYVCSSPIADTCGVKHTTDPDQLAQWQTLGELLSERLGHPTGKEANDQQR